MIIPIVINYIFPWLPEIFFSVVFIIAVFKYSTISRPKYKLLITSVVVFRFFYAVLLTAGQYYVWSQNKFTELLLKSPFYSGATPSIIDEFCRLSIVDCRKSGYFIFYSYGRFWMNVFISIGAAIIFYLFLKSLKKYRERFFDEGETELGFLAALIVGWPDFVVFLPLVFVSVVLISVYRRIFLKEMYVTLGWPFIFAVFSVLVFGGKLLQIFNLAVLRV